MSAPTHPSVSLTLNFTSRTGFVSRTGFLGVSTPARFKASTGQIMSFRIRVPEFNFESCGQNLDLEASKFNLNVHEKV